MLAFETIKEVKHFSIILDYTPNRTHKKELNLMLPYVDVSMSPVNIKEYFFQNFFKIIDMWKVFIFMNLQLQ